MKTHRPYQISKGCSTLRSQQTRPICSILGEFDTASSNLLAGAKDACSLSPARRNRARGDDTSSCSSSSNPTLSLPSFSSDLVNDDRLKLPRFGRRITTYENADQRLMGQAFCSSHKIMLPSLIIPVCSSEESEDIQSLVLSTLYALFNCFMSTFSLFSLFNPSHGLKRLWFHRNKPSV